MHKRLALKFLALSAFSAAIYFGFKHPLIAQNDATSNGMPSVPPVFVEIAPPARTPEPPAQNLPPTPLDSVEFGKLNTQLQEVTNKFGRMDYQAKKAYFDGAAARRAGYDNQIVKLAEEMVAHQNDLTEALMSGKTRFGSNFEVDPQKYPRFRKFRDRATARVKKTNRIISTEGVTPVEL